MHLVVVLAHPAVVNELELVPDCCLPERIIRHPLLNGKSRLYIRLPRLALVNRVLGDPELCVNLEDLLALEDTTVITDQPIWTSMHLDCRVQDLQERSRILPS